MEAISGARDFSKPRGRTYIQTSAKLSITKPMPHLDTGARITSFCPAASLRGFMNANDHTIQQRITSARATI
jgi:hypothetical protein